MPKVGPAKCCVRHIMDQAERRITRHMHHARDASIVTQASIRGMIGVLLMLLGNCAFALDPALQPSQYVLDRWQTAEGLPQNSAAASPRQFATCRVRTD